MFLILVFRCIRHHHRILRTSPTVCNSANKTSIPKIRRKNDKTVTSHPTPIPPNQKQPPCQPHPLVKYGVRSPNFIWASCAQLYSVAETPQLPPPPHFGSYSRALLISQDRQHLLVTY